MANFCWLVGGNEQGETPRLPGLPGQRRERPPASCLSLLLPGPGLPLAGPSSQSGTPQPQRRSPLPPHIGRDLQSRGLGEGKGTYLVLWTEYIFLKTFDFYLDPQTTLKVKYFQFVT